MFCQIPSILIKQRLAVDTMLWCYSFFSEFMKLYVEHGFNTVFNIKFDRKFEQYQRLFWVMLFSLVPFEPFPHQEAVQDNDMLHL